MPPWESIPASVARMGIPDTRTPVSVVLKTWKRSDYQRGDGLVSLVA